MPHEIKEKYLNLGTPATYRIVVEGHLEERWSDRLAGMRIRSRERADHTVETTLIGQVRDQAELTGLLNNLYELHLPILLVTRVFEE